MALTKVTPDLLTLTVGDGGLTQNNFTDALKTKVDGIEASADVTDTANVTAAGALMDSELTSEASVKALNQGVATTDSPTFAGVTLATADINAGTIDGTAIGASSASTGAFTTLTASGTFTASPSGGVATLGANGHITSKQSLDVATAGGRYIGSSNRGILGQLRIEQATTGADGGYIDFDTCANGSTSPTTRMRINSSGQVGIGTSSPSKTLTVAKAQTANTAMEVLRLTGSGAYSSSGSSNAGAGLSFGQYHDTYPDWNLSQIEGIRSGGSWGGSLVFKTNDNTAQTNSTERMRIDSSGNVGVGITSSLEKFTVANASSGIVGRFTNNTNQTLDLGVISGSGAAGGVYYNSANSGYHAFQVGGTEKMRIDSSGNLLVGKTATALGTAGHTFGNDGYLYHTRSGDIMFLNRLNSDGTLISFLKNGVNIGNISSYGASRLSIGSGDIGLVFAGDYNAIYPNDGGLNSQDNAVDLGLHSVRFDDIYATNGTIQTSDRNEKQDIAELSDAEQRVAVACKGLLRKFRWKDSVAEKGDDARIHFGIIAQDLQAAFEAEGLDAGDYAMFISTTWTDEETNEEKTRMGVRYSELLAFIISAI